MEEAEKLALLARINEVFSDGTVPHNRALALEAMDCGPGLAVVRLPYSVELVGNPETGVLHGGAVTTLLDATAGMAVLVGMPQPSRVATLDLRIDYLKPATPGQDLIARVECYKRTHHVAFVRGVAHHGNIDDPVASAAGTFMTFPEPPAAPEAP